MAHLVAKVLPAVPGITTALKHEDILDVRQFHLKMANDDVRKRIRFKGSDPTQPEMFSQDDLQELLELDNYLWWRQNIHGTIPNCMFNVMTTTRDEFLTFQVLPIESREGGDINTGRVRYDPRVALHYEEVNKIGAFLPQGNQSARQNSGSGGQQPQGTGGNTGGGSGGNTGGGSGGNNAGMTAAEKELKELMKKTKPSDQVYPTFEQDSEYSTWSVNFKARLKLVGLGSMLEETYQPPDDSAPEPEKELHQKKNLSLFIILSEKVKTDSGEFIVKTHADTEDGMAIWHDLKKHYRDDMSAVQRTDFLANLIDNIRLPTQCKQITKAHNGFWKLIRDHNNCCTPAQRISPELALGKYERYIRPNAQMHGVRVQLDAQDVLAKSQGNPKLKTEYRIAFYKDTAIRLDAEYKSSVLTSTRNVNYSQLYGGLLDPSSLWDNDITVAQSQLQNFSLPDDSGYTSGIDYDINASIGDRHAHEVSDEELSNMEAFYVNYSVNVGAQVKLPEWHLAPEIWKRLSSKQKKGWLSLGQDLRKDLLSGSQSLRGDLPPPPTHGENIHLPGTGVTGRHGRATNMTQWTPDGVTSEYPSLPPVPETSASTLEAYTTASTPSTDTSPSIIPPSSTMDPNSEIAIINAMRANSGSTPQTGLSPSGGLHASRRDLTVKHPLDPKRLLSNKNASSNQLIPIPKNNVSSSSGTSTRAVHTALSNHVPIERGVNATLQQASFPDVQVVSTPGAQRPEWRVNMALTRPHSLINEDPIISDSVIDGGANGGFGHPRYLRLLAYASPARRVDVVGVGNGRIGGLRIGSFAGTATTMCGTRVLLIFNEYGELMEDDDTAFCIHSKLQLEHGGCIVHDRPRQLNGEQSIITPSAEGYVIPLSYRNGLPFMRTSYPTDDEMRNLPFVVMTSGATWNVSQFDDGQEIDQTVQVTSTVSPETALLQRVDAMSTLEPDGEEDLLPKLEPVHGDEDTSRESEFGNTDYDGMPALVMPRTQRNNLNESVMLSLEDNIRRAGVSEPTWQSDRSPDRSVNGIQIPLSHQQAMEFDHNNGDTKWGDAEKVEIERLFGLGIFETVDMNEPFIGLPHMKLFWVYSCKADGTRKARITTYGRLGMNAYDANFADNFSRMPPLRPLECYMMHLRRHSDSTQFNHALIDGGANAGIAIPMGTAHSPINWPDERRTYLDIPMMELSASRLYSSRAMEIERRTQEHRHVIRSIFQRRLEPVETDTVFDDEGAVSRHISDHVNVDTTIEGTTYVDDMILQYEDNENGESDDEEHDTEHDTT